VASGLLIAASVPPLGFWPLGIVGLALLVALLRDRPVRTRALLGFLSGIGLYAVTISWFAEFNAIGAIASMAVEAAFLAGAAAATPPGRGRRAGFVGAVILQDWVRTYIPFGGVPLGGVPLGQAAGPLVAAARIGGQLGLTGVAAAAGVALELLVTTLVRRRGEAATWKRAALLAVMFSIVIALPLAGALTPSGHPVGTMRVALVQGGGPRGLRAVESDTQRVFDAQVAESAQVQGPVDLIVWPEDVVALTGPLAGSPEEAKVGAVAKAHHAAVLAGVTEDVGSDKFRNAMVEWSPDGSVAGRYDKVHRVPFGEYVPLRSLVEHVVSLDAIPRDAVPGHGSGALATPAGKVAITISYEVFFPDRARSAVRDGGEVLLVPTNTASYTTTQVSAAEVAALRIRAWSTGRDVAMVAPTGWSAFVSSRGRVLRRSPLEAPAVLEGTLTRRTGRTPYVRWGDLPALVAAAALVGAGWARSLRS
jgi:apolipoprotein N-acyltransferase